MHNVLTSYAMSSALTDVAGAMTTDPLAYAMGYSCLLYTSGSRSQPMTTEIRFRFSRVAEAARQ